MKLLPSEKRIKVEEAKKDFVVKSKIEIHEPCNCGDHIRHNDGGNYHESVFMQIDEGRYFRKIESSCKLISEAEWEEISKEEAISTIDERGDWL